MGTPYRLLLGTMLLALLPLEGCTAPSPTRGGFSSAAPAARAKAIEETVTKAESSGTLERADLKAMVELLLADDALVRFMAIAGLTKLTGDSFGYRFFDPPPTRYMAVLTWRAYALNATTAGTIRIQPPPSDADENAATKVVQR